MSVASTSPGLRVHDLPSVDLAWLRRGLPRAPADACVRRALPRPDVLVQVGKQSAELADADGPRPTVCQQPGQTSLAQLMTWSESDESRTTLNEAAEGLGILKAVRRSDTAKGLHPTADTLVQYE
ncbi:hypothetical protein Ct61P_02542 [Colletotrichum tofieldiae]|nr:hypothetical protein Ct61P_02542 [Colletotrichum tofieldiae]